MTKDRRFIPWRCRLFGHKWKPSHRVERTQPYGLLAWVYQDDVCLRCYSTEYRLPRGDSQQDQLPYDARAHQARYP